MIGTITFYEATMESSPLMTAEYQSELEKNTREYLDRLRQIDHILQGPIRTIIRYSWSGTLLTDDRPPRYPEWLTEKRLEKPTPKLVPTNVCLATIQHLQKLIRRFPWLEDEAKASIDAAAAIITERYQQEYTPEDYFRRCVQLLSSPTFGMLNPISASEIFRLLMGLGEQFAHSGAGCLAFFALLWPLRRRRAGARIDPSPTNAYVTAKCLIPLVELRSMCHRRAQLYSDVRGNIHRLALLKEGCDPYASWKFQAELDELYRNVSDLKSIAIDRIALERCEQQIGEMIRQEPTELPAVLYEKVLKAICNALEGIAATSTNVYNRANETANLIEMKLVKPLREIREFMRRSDGEPPWAGSPPSNESDVTAIGESLKDLGFFSEDDNGLVEALSEKLAGMPVRKLPDLAVGAEKSLTKCREIIRQIQNAAVLSQPFPLDVEQAKKALATLADANREVAKALHTPIRKHARYCEQVLNREIAYASADNLTDFDAAELASALTVAIRTELLESRPQVEDAVAKTLVGMQRDGSWRPGTPYFLLNGSAGIRPPSAEIVWALASAVKRHPGIRVADPYLFQFVDWLERTQRTLPREERYLAELVPARIRNESDQVGNERPLAKYLQKTIGDKPDVGWPADRVRKERQIHLETTAYAVNALLAVRELVEHRLWELCERRFTLAPAGVSLKKMDPVDLMAPHAHRLHFKLAEIARQAQAAGAEAKYSLILHGPPGSSKTAVAGALSQEMWKRTPRLGRAGHRLIRITPADFTRMGEDRVDSEAQLIFNLLSHVRGVTILFDEIDDLLRRRDFATKERARFLDLVTPAMLNRLQDLRDVCKKQELCFLFGTNYIEKIEPALMRPGRIDARLPVVYPDYRSRQALAYKAFEKWREKHPLSEPHRDALERSAALLATAAAAWPWNLYVRLCKQFTDDVLPKAGKPDDPWLGLSGKEKSEAYRVAESTFAGWWEKQAMTHNAEAELRKDYERRLNESPGSAELHIEYLYYMISLVGGEAGTEHALKESFGGSELVKELREHLVDDIAFLPHVKVSSGVQADANSGAARVESPPVSAPSRRASR
jgi:hypothetical protein